ncbi:MAG: hypothetical protein V4792_08000 [Pseudomonadota bacterium]
MGIADFGYGANESLQEILRQKFIELTQRQRNEQVMRGLDLEQGRDAVGAELGRGNLGLRQKEFDASQQPVAEKPVVVSGRLVMPSTGKVLFEPPAATPAAPRPFNVNGRLVSPEGKVIYASPKEAAAPKVDPRTKDDPSLPRGVQDYLLKLRSKYGSFEEAATELAQAAPELRAAHPSLDSAKALNTLRAQYGGTANPRAPQTPEDIEAAAAARARGTAAGKGATGGNLLSKIPNPWGGGDKPAGPKVGERRSINGQMAQWDGQGWVAVQ